MNVMAITLPDTQNFFCSKLSSFVLFFKKKHYYFSFPELSTFLLGFFVFPLKHKFTIYCENDKMVHWSTYSIYEKHRITYQKIGNLEEKQQYFCW